MQLVLDLPVLQARTGPTVMIVGMLPVGDSFAAMVPLLKQVNALGVAWVCRCWGQVEMLSRIGIQASFLPNNEICYEGPDRHTPKTVLFSGFYWPEKNIPMFLSVAMWLSNWQFVLHAPRVEWRIPLPDNVRTVATYYDDTREYLEFLANHEYIWLPRFRAMACYQGRSGITAIASGRVVILPDLPVNEEIPPGCAVKYPYEYLPHEIGELIASRPQVDRAAIGMYMATVDPRNVWQLLQNSLASLPGGN
jgi:hypothetical protein